MLEGLPYLESLYNNRAALPDFQSYIDRWAANSSGICRSMKDQCERDVPYGDSMLETMDVYLPTSVRDAMMMFGMALSLRVSGSRSLGSVATKAAIQKAPEDHRKTTDSEY